MYKENLMKRRLIITLAVASCVATFGSQQVLAIGKSEAAAVEKSFDDLKQALLKRDGQKIIAQLTPGTMEMFDGCRKLALTPDKAELSLLSQIEVIIGYQAYWRIPRQELQSMSATNLFLWATRNGIVDIHSFMSVDLDHLQRAGSRVTACVKNGDMVLTNAVVSFECIDGEWKLDFRDLILSSDALLTPVRNAMGLSKSEMAVMAIERINRQPIQMLRELLLSPNARKLVAQLRNAGPARVYESALSELAEGRQRDAEAILNMFVDIHTNDQRLIFAQAVCSRSRWSKETSTWQFNHVLEMDPTTLEGNCARYILDLDGRKRVPENMNSLHLLITRNPDNPLLLWLMAMECRDNFKLTDETTYSRSAAQCYRQMLKMWKVGPVLVHQTFANVLSEELDQQEEALKHRRIAVEMEPASWTYFGLANTLYSMKKYGEANEAYKKLVELDPHSVDHWRNWADCLYDQKLYDECIDKCKKALECDPSFFRAYNTWGNCLDSQGKYEPAKEKYRKSIALNPAYRIGYINYIRILENHGDHAEARRMQEQLDKIQPKHSGSISTNLTAAPRATFLGKLKGADLPALSAIFGKLEKGKMKRGDVTAYDAKAWHERWNISLWMHKDKNLEILIVCKCKEKQATLAQWKTALLKDFGIKADRVRLKREVNPSLGVIYEVELIGCAPEVRKVAILVKAGALLDPAGSTLEALQESAIVSSDMMIML